MNYYQLSHFDDKDIFVFVCVCVFFFWFQFNESLFNFKTTTIERIAIKSHESQHDRIRDKPDHNRLNRH